MNRTLLLILTLFILGACSKDDVAKPTPPNIPPILDGVITEFNLSPKDLTTPGEGDFVLFANATFYNVTFDATAKTDSNAYIIFASDTILNDQSREFSNLGNDEVAWFPIRPNQVIIFFTDGRKITGTFDAAATFGGVFGESVIGSWREQADPAKPNQKAKDDIIHLVHRYADIDGPGPETDRQYIFAKVALR